MCRPARLARRLIETLKRNGFDPSEQHGFIPHITLKYTTGGEPVAVAPRDVSFGTVDVAIGGRRSAFPLRGLVAGELSSLPPAGAWRGAPSWFASSTSMYRSAVYNAVLEYLVRDNTRATAFKAAAGQALLDRLPRCVLCAYRAGGAEEVDAGR
jgi:hypothetical protein